MPTDVVATITELLNDGFACYATDPAGALAKAEEAGDLACRRKLPEKIARSQMLAAYALELLSRSPEAIADLLCISLRTVESHRYNIRKKLDLPGSSNLATQIAARLEAE